MNSGGITANLDGTLNYGIDEVEVLENVDGYTIIVTKPLLYTHISEIRTINGRVLDMRSEVGLLSRNIVIQVRLCGLSGINIHLLILMLFRAMKTVKDSYLVFTL